MCLQHTSGMPNGKKDLYTIKEGRDGPQLEPGK